MWEIYVIEIMPQWYPLVAEGLPPGKRCYYVGQTSKSCSARYKEHRTGRSDGDPRFNRPGKVFTTMRNAQEGRTLRRNFDTTLRRTMTEGYELLKTEQDAIDQENWLNDKLRREGHAVYPVGDGTLPFESYRS